MRKCHVYPIINIILILCWLFIFSNTDSYFSIYVLCGIIGMIILRDTELNVNLCKFRYEKYLITILSVLFSVIVSLSNYRLIYDIIKLNKNIYILLLLLGIIGGGICAHNILLYLCVRVKNIQVMPQKNSYNIYVIAIISMFLIVGIYVLNLFFCSWPGNLSTDSISQIVQIMENTYSNHHPYWHTMVIKVFYDLGMMLFHDINVGVALYSLFQICFMAGCFTFVITTIYQLNVPIKYIVMILLWYMFMPFHIIYSATMWKDVMFAGAVTIFITALFRYMNNIGKNNVLFFFVGGMGMCLWRTNGWLAFVATFLVFTILFRNKYKLIIVFFLLVTIISYLLKGPYLDAIGVNQPDFVESLSIPVQQIARVVDDGGELTEEQRDLLGKIIDIDSISEEYLNYVSDPIKNAIRRYGNVEYLVNNKWEYFKLWVSIGLEHPRKYMEAWIDQTKGYWNGGYDYWIWYDWVNENQIGIKRVCHSEILSRWKYVYSSEYTESFFLQVFVSIGFHIWIVGKRLIK